VGTQPEVWTPSHSRYSVCHFSEAAKWVPSQKYGLPLTPGIVFAIKDQSSEAAKWVASQKYGLPLTPGIVFTTNVTPVRQPSGYPARSMDSLSLQV
jgi:hypothetical protein